MWTVAVSVAMILAVLALTMGAVGMTAQAMTDDYDNSVTVAAMPWMLYFFVAMLPCVAVMIGVNIYEEWKNR